MSLQQDVDDEQQLGCRLRREARTLLTQLAEFPTAADALTAIFGAFEHDPTRAHVLQLLLEWQSLAQGDRALHDVIMSFERRDCSEEIYTEDASIKDVNASNSYNDSSWMLLVMGKPALLFATSIYDEDLALLVWRGLVRFDQLQHCDRRRFSLIRQALDNAYDSHGFCALHYAIEAQMHELFVCIAKDLSDDNTAEQQQQQKDVHALLPSSQSLPLLCQYITTQDVVLPMGKNQIQGKNIASGGCSLLHLAAKKGDLALVQLLTAPPFDFHPTLSSSDWDGNTPLQLARLHSHDTVAAFLGTLHAHASSPTASSPSVERLSPTELTTLRDARDARAKQRYIASLDAAPSMLEPHTFEQLWSKRECDDVVAVLDRIATTRGWCTQRHAAYPTTDLPCYCVVPIDAWVRGSIANRLFPQLHAQYAIPFTTKRITFRELFYVKYEAAGSERAELAVHCDGSVLSFNVLLNDARAFVGGGTFFEATGETIHIERGDAVVHSGKVRHAGAPVVEGKRLILVGFLDVIDRVF